MKPQTSLFTDLFGYINPDTVNPGGIYNWSPLIKFMALSGNKYDDYGLGSALFNFQNEDNIFSEIAFKNVNFKNIFWRVGKTAPTNPMPGIFSTKVSNSIVTVDRLIMN